METSPRIKAHLGLLQERLFVCDALNIFDSAGMPVIDYNGDVVFQLKFDFGIAFLNVMAAIKPDSNNRNDTEGELDMYFKTMEYRRVSQSFDLIWLCNITAPDNPEEPIIDTEYEIVEFAILELIDAVSFAANILCPEEEIEDDPETPPWSQSENPDGTPPYSKTVVSGSMPPFGG